MRSQRTHRRAPGQELEGTNARDWAVLGGELGVLSNSTSRRRQHAWAKHLRRISEQAGVSTPHSHPALPPPKPTPLIRRSSWLTRAGYHLFLHRTQKLLERAQERKGKKRSAAAKAQGHQKTPTMIEAIMRDALRGEEEEGVTPPGGGFTDVGMHTGGAPRNTSWPLVRAVVQVQLEQAGEHHAYRMGMAQLALWETERRLAQSRARLLAAGPVVAAMEIDCTCQMLEEAAVEGAALADAEAHEAHGESVRLCLQAFEARCALVRWTLEQIANERAERTARAHELPLQPPPPHKLVSLRLPLRATREPTVLGLAAVRARAQLNLGWLPAPPAPCASIMQLKLWLAHPLLSDVDGGSEAAVMLALSSVERVLFCRSAKLGKLVTAGFGAFDSEAQALEAVLNQYRHLASKFAQTRAAEAQFRTGLRSRETLVLWIGFCVAHEAALQCSPELRSYAPALDWRDLRWLILEDKSAVDAALHVAAYLQAKQAPAVADKPVFSLRRGDKTFDFAREYSRRVHGKLWRAEHAAAQRRTDAHYAVVLEKQRRLHSLDEEMTVLRSRLSEAVAERRGMQSLSVDVLERVARQSKLDRLQIDITLKEEEIRSVEQPPPPVYQPLPRNKDKADAILFFLFITPAFRILSRLSFCAAQAMLPRADRVQLTGSQQLDVAACIKRARYATSWIEYYTNHTPQYKLSCQPDVRVGSAVSAPQAHDFGPNNVRRFSCPDDGVFYPDSLTPSFYWNGGGFELDERSCGYFDPFALLPDEARALEYTERLRAEDEGLNWTIVGGDAPPGRGNVPEARQDARPAWLSDKAAFLCFGALRAYPHQQARKLCIALAERSLPLLEPSVRTLLLSAMYQLGELRNDRASVCEPLLWRTDLSLFDGWAALRRALAGLSEELRDKPREYGALLVLGELAAHASQWDSPARDVARDLARTARLWAEAQREDSSPSAEQSAARARRCLFCLYGVVCNGLGDLSSEDAAELCRLLLLADYSRLFAEPTPYDHEVRVVGAIALAAAARRLPQLQQHVELDGRMLTEAVRCVLQTQTPAHLVWRCMRDERGSAGCCYEAIADYGSSAMHHFSLNLLTGVVLLDGWPPSRLPATILDLPLYKRVFGASNFEVTRDACGVLTTLRPVGGRSYTFYVDGGGRLEVLEREGNAGRASGRRAMELELLDGCAAGIESWGAALPPRLKEMHSHWTCREHNLLVLRPRQYDRREVQFALWAADVIGEDDEEAGDSDGEEEASCASVPVLCQRVPPHMRVEVENIASFIDEHVADLLLNGQPASSCGPGVDGSGASEVELLVLPQPSRILSALSKFETDVAFIHAFFTGRGTRVFELTRYGLSFELRDGRLHSDNFVGFAMAPRQQLAGMMYGFEQYLILDALHEAAPSLVLVPAGPVICTADRVAIDGSSGCADERRHHVYEVNPRFGTVEARGGQSAIEARLQLAAIFAAIGTALPEDATRQTGGEVAVDLMRQCWKAHPHTPAELVQLGSLHGLSRLTPGVALLAEDLGASARELSLLHPLAGAVPAARDPAAAAEYILRKQAARSCERGWLTGDEERYVLGFAVSVRPEGREMPDGAHLDVKISGGHQAEDALRALSHALSTMVVATGGAAGGAPKFPLDMTRVAQTELGRNLQSELEASWHAHQQVPIAQLAASPAELVDVLTRHQLTIAGVRAQLEASLLTQVDRVPSEHHWHAPGFNMRRAANLQPRATLRDLARAACDLSRLRVLNPFLSDAALTRVHAHILLWLRLCVVEDKLARMLAHASTGNRRELEREAMQACRPWSMTEHPHWLVFEVEQRMQIRREQHTMARFLLNQPWTLSQLNMGEGKTRVILPMLILELARPGGSRLVRLNFLSQLLCEAYDFLHRSLTASLFVRRLVRLPFHRDVRLSALGARRMAGVLARCRDAGGSLVMAPEHRLSLRLKADEARLAGDKALLAELAALDGSQHRGALAGGLQYLDVMDESDAILSHKYQLIYAVGGASALPSGRTRWVVVQALLKAVSHRDGPVYTLLAPSDVSRRVSQLQQRGAGSFDDIRFLPGRALDSRMPQLLRALAAHVLDHCPYHLRWLEGHRSEPGRELILRFVTDAQMSLDDFRAAAVRRGVEMVGEAQEETLLALRGLLAYGLAPHCLCRRHRVEYGVDARRGPKVRVAVPFRASDTPSERSEYAQPDTLILLTTLAYYHSGLSQDQVREAVGALLSLGPVAQQTEYDLWFSSAVPTLPAEAREALNHVHKLDPSNLEQLARLHATYGHNMAAIDFWLSSCVLPRETMQFPHRLVANAFHLTAPAHTSGVVGFSGTRDSHPLLPSHVTQRTCEGSSDGKMIELILRNQRVAILGSGERAASCADGALRGAALDLCVAEGAVALIDAGAAMAGWANPDVAEEAARRLRDSSSALQGVVYFDTREGTWLVRSLQGRVWAHGSSPMRERDCFVFFDESHCRGADMKLRADALAVLTLGQGMSKDTLMQAAGRMRKLDQAQELLFAVPPELVPMICAARNGVAAPGPQKQQSLRGAGCETRSANAGEHGLSPRDLLQWVLCNTAAATGEGLIEWGKQGSHFGTTHHPQARVLDERLQLDVLYGSAVREASAHEVVSSALQHGRERCRSLGELSHDEHVCRAIVQHVRRLGSDVRAAVSGIDEEVERELECERRAEKERERQLPRREPAVPEVWDFASVFDRRTASSNFVPTDLDPAAGVVNLSDAFNSRCAHTLFGNVWHCDLQAGFSGWHECRIFVTHSFMETVLDEEPQVEMAEYLRPVDALIVFGGSRSCLLVSEWEADQLLALVWDRPPAGDASAAFLTNAAYMRHAADAGGPWPPVLAVPRRDRSEPRNKVAHVEPPLGENTLAALQLLAGETMYATDARKAAVRALLSSPGIKSAVRELVCVRGRGQMLARSDLERICADWRD